MKLTRRVAVLCSASFFLVSSAFAQTAEERAGARAAARQGIKAYDEKRWEEAVDLMSRAEKLMHAPTHLLYQALAEEKLSHLVVAQELFMRIVYEKLGPDAPAAFLSAQAEAKKHAESLTPRLSYVRVLVQGLPSGTSPEVTIDGKRLPDALVGVQSPVDPGKHSILATAPGMTSSTTELTLKEGESNSVTLSLAANASASNKASANSSTAPAPAFTSNAPTSKQGTMPNVSTNDAPKGNQGSSGLKTGGYIGLGVGAVGVTIGTIFAIRANGLRNDANDYANSVCTLPNGGCPPQYRTSIDSKDSKADSARSIAVAGFVVGGAGVAAGVTMLLLSPSNPSHDSAFVRPFFTTNGAGVFGTF